MLIDKCTVGLAALATGAIFAAATYAVEPPPDTPGAGITKHAKPIPLRLADQPMAAHAPRRITIENPRVLHFHHGPQGSVAGPPPGVTVYRNEINLEGPFFFFTPNDRDTFMVRTMADDLELAQGDCDRLAWYQIAVLGDGISGLPTFNVHVELRTGNTCDRSATLIPGTEMDFTGLPNDGTTVSLLSMPIALDPAVFVPGSVWLWMTVTNATGGYIDDVGWILAERAEVGLTEDKFSVGSTGARPIDCEFFFPQTPNQPAIYAGFWAVLNCDLGGDPEGACCNGVTCTQLSEVDCGIAGGIWQGAFTPCAPSPCLNGACCTGDDFATCSETTEAGCSAPDRLFHPLGTCDQSLCKSAFTTYLNDFNTGFFNPMPIGARWADNLNFVPCDEFIAFSIDVVGAAPDSPILGCPDAPATFDVRLELWTNDDKQTSDTADDVPLAPIEGTFQRFRNIRSDFFAKTLLAGPFPKIPVDGNIWVVLSTSSCQAGPIFAGLADPGNSRDSFAVIDDPDVPDSSGMWVGDVGFPGDFSAETCPQGDLCNPADSFHIKAWCQGDLPRGTCCNDAAGTAVTGVQEAFCDGRWNIDAAGGAAAFDPPCGTGACCTQFGCTNNLADECVALGQMQGVPVSFRGGSLCDEIPCPQAECLEAAGDCFSNRLTPGCEDAYCCDTVCSLPNNEICCSDQWDRVCASDAARLCEPTLRNDHCSNAESLGNAVGDFVFDTTLATTDGPPHSGCLDGGEQDHIINDQWFCWTSPCDGNITVTTCDLSDVDTKLAVYDGCGTCPPTDTDLIACNDDACSANPTQSTVVFSARIGEQKTIRLGMFPVVDAARGAGQFRIFCGAPFNPACPGAGDCCGDNGSVGCTDRPCCDKVCACDPFCCDVTWDAACAGGGRLGTGCGAAVLCGACVTAGDMDGNGFIDLDDWSIIGSVCVQGPGANSTPARCEAADFDGNGKIDMHDVGRFLQVINTTAP